MEGSSSFLNFLSSSFYYFWLNSCDFNVKESLQNIIQTLPDPHFDSDSRIIWLQAFCDIQLGKKSIFNSI